MTQVRKVAIIGGTRIPFCRSFTAYASESTQNLLLASIKGLVDKYNLKDKKLGEVVSGAVMKHSKDWNLTREVVMLSGLAKETPAYDIQQACGTSLEATILVANKIALSQIDCGIASGVDTNSDLPIVYNDKFSHRLMKSALGRNIKDRVTPFIGMSPKELIPVKPGINEPQTGLSMGQHCEIMAKKWKLTQKEQDELAFQSHKKATQAYEEGFYNDLITPFKDTEKDNNVRPNTTLEKLATLRPAFDRSDKGTLTAGNSTPLTDGSSAVLLASEEWAQKNDLPILAYFSFGQTAAVDYVDKEGLLMAPVYAVSEMLKKQNLNLQDFDFYEIHEAFAAQALCTLKAWESEEFCREHLQLDSALGSIDRSKLNVKGGSVALGHPFAATGTRIVSSLAKMLNEKGSGRGLISICTAGGMGVTAIIEK